LSVVSGQRSVKYADNIVVPTEKLPDWMLQLAEQIKLIPPDADLPLGVIVGSAEIARCELLVACGNEQPATGNQQQAPIYQWHLKDVERAETLRKPTKHPQPVFFMPF
jgi:hypothetical protein